MHSRDALASLIAGPSRLTRRLSCKHIRTKQHCSAESITPTACRAQFSTEMLHAGARDCSCNATQQAPSMTKGWLSPHDGDMSLNSKCFVAKQATLSASSNVNPPSWI